MRKSSDKRATLRDVARLSGVSYQTVSRVINNHPYVAAETAGRVRQAILELDFRPHRVARSLATRRAGAIAVLTHGITYYGLARLLAGVEQAAADGGYHLVYANCIGAHDIKAALERFNDDSVDGIITILPVQGTEYEKISRYCAKIPIVQVDAELGANSPSVVIEHRFGERQVTDHLTELGHKHICEVRGPLNSYSANARHRGWLDAIAATEATRGLSRVGDWTAASGYRATQKLIAQDPGFTALVAANDQMALGAMLALRDAGLAIPEDVSIVGYDDQPESGFFFPPLTTVGLDYDLLGRQTVGYLLERMAAPDASFEQKIIYPELILRKSTGNVDRGRAGRMQTLAPDEVGDWEGLR